MMAEQAQPNLLMDSVDYNIFSESFNSSSEPELKTGEQRSGPLNSSITSTMPTKEQQFYPESVSAVSSSASPCKKESESSRLLETPEPSMVPFAEQLQFYPRDYWGLNYYFRVFNKMYICDVLYVPEYPLFPGAFSYKNHPIYKVDILGVIVKKIERNKCFIYAVDDGTGVISCCCWKNDITNPLNTVSIDDELPEILKQKMRNMLERKLTQSDGYSLGDLLHVRGKIKVYLGQKEVVATYHNKIDNPMFEVARMAELPKLYKQKYDRPFKLPHKVAQELDMIKQEEITGVKCQKRVMKELKEEFLKYFTTIEVAEISVSELLYLETVQKILKQLNHEDNVHKVTNTQVVNQTLSMMEDDGLVYKKIADIADTYEILSKHSSLEDTIKQILVTESVKPKYCEKGCHYYHVLDELHKTFQYAKVKKSCLMYCLNKLETQSDIIRTTQHHYLAYNT